ncbi:tissue factor pathway inhibitor a isoform X2 [Denticeps clupeoides]|uniref:tissue factor pathway inhibitor a isoform X2 n=1 Tax=Denticeps clupeoides TaxID=299321 RepID=UPI0010A54EE0|nr:tissue factor pathway inhibitor-like isoform X2 [Denticeps clupeoides]
MASFYHGFSLLALFLGHCNSHFIRDGGPPPLRLFHHSCALKKDEGPCKAIKESFYFNIDTGHCESFEYGGCQGNANNFETLEKCEEMCVVKENKSPCHLEDEPGPCRGLVPRYYFDSKSQECKKFFYGGCFGNANNFKTIKQCQDKCQRTNGHIEKASQLDEDAHILTAHRVMVEPNVEKPTQPSEEAHVLPDDSAKGSHAVAERQESSDTFLPEICLHPINRGTCDGTERRYVFNAKTKRCQLIRYTGCGGNSNNFVLKRHCMKMCMKDHHGKKYMRIKKKNTGSILFRSF